MGGAVHDLSSRNGPRHRSTCDGRLLHNASMTTVPRASTLAVAAALGTVYVVWGSTYLAIAYVVDSMPPLLAAGARFTLAGGLMLSFLVARDRWRGARDNGPGKRLHWPRAVEWRTALIVGSLLLLGGN